MCKGYEPECTGCIECNPKPKGHPHAELMMQYAEDAKVHEHPWELWETSYNEGRTWYIPNGPLRFHPNKPYRRKPRTININGYEVPEPVREVTPGVPYFATVIDLRTEDDGIKVVYGIPSRNNVERGIVHTTREAAELHAKALLSFTKK